MSVFGAAPPPEGPSDVALLAAAIESVAESIKGVRDRTEFVMVLPSKVELTENSYTGVVQLASAFFKNNSTYAYLEMRVSNGALQMDWMQNGERLASWFHRG